MARAGAHLCTLTSLSGALDVGGVFSSGELTDMHCAQPGSTLRVKGPRRQPARWGRRWSGFQGQRRMREGAGELEWSVAPVPGVRDRHSADQGQPSSLLRRSRQTICLGHDAEAARVHH